MLLISCHRFTALLLALFVLVNGVWMSVESSEQFRSPDSAGWHQHEHTHTDSATIYTSGQTADLAVTAVDCSQHHCCHLHNPVAIQSLTGAVVRQQDYSPHRPINFQCCSQSSKPPVPPPDFA